MLSSLILMVLAYLDLDIPCDTSLEVDVVRAKRDVP